MGRAASLSVHLYRSSDKAAKILQSNALVRSKQFFSMMQWRLFYLAMKAVARSDVEFRDFIIPEPYLRELMNADYGSFREKLYDATNGLVGTTVSIHHPTGSWAHIAVFQTTGYLNAEETSESRYKTPHRYPVVRMKLHNDLKANLLKLEKVQLTAALVRPHVSQPARPQALRVPVARLVGGRADANRL